MVLVYLAIAGIQDQVFQVIAVIVVILAYLATLVQHQQSAALTLKSNITTLAY